ncbi:hypothetical protein DMB65_18380 [Flavobacterium cheongpyeongense]|jgi:hypothetical protein|uniref:Uncharacterized protein n=1 Tax=Flavobacterium cheongpyeongense TaxID=2212651 RepID=A0A2V4BLA6_9FLAO|nr:hypothetical protein [Flavobacterium cheongpyeongense]PXY39322.1 hypothetical protein DMB65_18380 [Flavobacterium cheongpyeongense]
MSFNLTYGLLFEVTLYHNYFLNSGEDTYEGMSDANKKKMLQKFDSDSFATLTPTVETNTRLRNYKMVFKPTRTGFRIYIKVKEDDEIDPFISVPADLKLDFIISINDYQFENYTNLEFVLKQMFLFSNTKPETEPVTFKYIPNFNDNVLISNNYLISEKTTAIFLSELHTQERQDVFGIISLTMKGDNNPKDIIDVAGKMLSPNFKIHFDNRKTLWKYIDRKAITEITTKTPKPLTYSGFVELDPVNDFMPSQSINSTYPNPSVKAITKINSDYYSEIFI